jgi:putative flippase GtrA
MAWFAVSGVLALGVDVLVLELSQAALGPYLGRVLSFLGAATFTWGFNRSLTFHTGSSDRPLREYGVYLLGMAWGGSVNYAAYVGSLHLLNFVRQTPAWGVVIGSLCGMVVNYLVGPAKPLQPA